MLSRGRLTSSKDSAGAGPSNSSPPSVSASLFALITTDSKCGREKQERLARRTEQLVLDTKNKPTSLDTYAGRLATFSLVWRGAVTGREVGFERQRLLPLTDERLAWAGLYYLPDAKIEDRTVCYACGKALHSWAPTDDPLYEHCNLNPQCPHVQVAPPPCFSDLGFVQAAPCAEGSRTPPLPPGTPANPSTGDHR